MKSEEQDDDDRKGELEISISIVFCTEFNSFWVFLIS